MKITPVEMWKAPDGTVHKSHQAAEDYWINTGRLFMWNNYLHDRWLSPALGYKMRDMIGHHKEIYEVLKDIYDAPPPTLFTT